MGKLESNLGRERVKVRFFKKTFLEVSMNFFFSTDPKAKLS